MSPKVLQELDLSQSSLGKNLLTEYIGDLLNSNGFAGSVVCGCTVLGESANITLRYPANGTEDGSCNHPFFHSLVP